MESIIREHMIRHLEDLKLINFIININIEYNSLSNDYCLFKNYIKFRKFGFDLKDENCFMIYWPFDKISAISKIK